MATPLSVNVDRGSDGIPVVAAAGEIDLSNVDTFARALSQAIAESGSSPSSLVVDMTAVEYLDSAAINTLFDYAEHIRIIANPVLLPVLTVGGLTQVATVETG